MKESVVFGIVLFIAVVSLWHSMRSIRELKRSAMHRTEMERRLTWLHIKRIIIISAGVLIGSMLWLNT